MAGVTMREEGDGVWVVTIPGVDLRHSLPEDLEERCYEIGFLVVGMDERAFHVSPRDDLSSPIDGALEELRHYLEGAVPGA